MSHVFAASLALKGRSVAGDTTMRLTTIFIAGLMLAGCSSGSSMLSGLGLGKDAPDERQVRTGQNLSMPPDLNLPAPANADSAYAPPSSEPSTAALASPGGPDDGIDDTGADPVTAAPAPAAPKDVFAQYGISRVKPDGAKKTDDELRLELRDAKLAEKRRLNPNYGTFKNLGDLFKDG
jgi:hypothetical protein